MSRRTSGDADGNGWKKYDRYEVEVDPAQDDKAKEILLCSFGRPHMRAFHCSWWSFFAAFFIWFAITPLLPTIQRDLQLTQQQLWTSNIAGVGSTIFCRFLLGPLCDVYGARWLFMIVLCTAAIPTACTGFVNSATGLAVLRGFIGIAGGSFVMCQYWTSRMFTKEVVGSANALVGGWGNLGAGVTQLVIGSALFPLFKRIYGHDPSRAWRTVSLIPAIVAFITGIVVYKITDDAPTGNFSELKRMGAFPRGVNTMKSFYKGAFNINTWVLFIQYACCFGVELTMNSAAALYFRDEFGQSTESAAAIASIFGWLNLFARGLGGFASDYCNSRWGMRGRLWAQTILLVLEGAFVLVFSHAGSLAGSIVTLVFFSFFVQAAEGTSYAIVPYICPAYMGSVCGIVGAGGNVGAVCFSFAFRELNYKAAFDIMGMTVIGSSFLSLLCNIKGHAGLCRGRDELVDRETGELLTFVEEDNASEQHV